MEPDLCEARCPYRYVAHGTYRLICYMHTTGAVYDITNIYISIHHYLQNLVNLAQKRDIRTTFRHTGSTAISTPFM